MEKQSITSTLGSRSDLAPRARDLLAQQLAECRQQLAPLFDQVLDDFEHDLFGTAEQSSGGQAQHEAMDALRLMQQSRPRFVARLMALLEGQFAGIGRDREKAAGAGRHAGGGDLELVDPQEFDESMALEDLATRTELHAAGAIYDLCHRYAVLIAAPPLDHDALPSGPNALAAVLGRAAEDFGLRHAQRLLFYRLCDRRIFAASEALYARLNDQLKESGILPDLRGFAPRRKSDGKEAPSEEATEERPTLDGAPSLLGSFGPLGSFGSPGASGFGASGARGSGGGGGAGWGGGSAGDGGGPGVLRARAGTGASGWGGGPAGEGGLRTPGGGTSAGSGATGAGNWRGAPGAPASIPPAVSFSPPPAVGNELHGLLDARRQALHPGQSGSAAHAGVFASLPQLEDALAALQAQPSRHGTPRSGEKLSEDLIAELNRIAGGEATQLEPGHRDAVDLVGLLSDHVRAATRATGTAQRLLTSLQVPLLRVALTDNTFFTVRNHPARRLLNVVLDTANLWLDRSGGPFDTTLDQRLQGAVQRVAKEYQGDLGVIERETDDLEAYVRILTRRAEIAERRQVEAAQGLERLRNARATATAAIEKRIAGRKITPLARALLENAWTDALTLTLLREGERSEAFRRQLAAADQVLEPSIERDTTRLAADLNRGLAQAGLQANEADQITRYALDLPQDAAATVPPPSQTELLIRLKSRHQPAEAGTGAPATSAPAEPVPHDVPLTPQAQHALETLKKLPFGTWLEFNVNQQGQTVARKLAWYAPASGRCLLVNARGAAAPERTLERIAWMMAHGEARVVPHHGEGMFDRAWAAVVAGLRRFGWPTGLRDTAT